MSIDEAKKELQGIISTNKELEDDDLLITLIKALDNLNFYREKNLICLEDAVKATRGIFYCGKYVSEIISDLPLVRS